MQIHCWARLLICLAETPDIAIMANHFLNLSPLKGYTDPHVTISHKRTTGTLLTNIFEGNPEGLNHPGFILRYLKSRNLKPSDDYSEYRLAMLSYIKELTSE